MRKTGAAFKYLDIINLRAKILDLFFFLLLFLRRVFFHNIQIKARFFVFLVRVRSVSIALLFLFHFLSVKKNCHGVPNAKGENRQDHRGSCFIYYFFAVAFLYSCKKYAFLAALSVSMFWELAGAVEQVARTLSSA